MTEITQTSPYSCTSDKILAKYFRYHNKWQLSSSSDKIQDYYVDKLGIEKLEKEKCMNPFFYFPRELWDLERICLGFKQTLVFPGFSAWSRITAKDYIRQLLATDDKLIEIYSTNPCVNKNVPIFCTENGFTNVGKNINHLCWHPNVSFDTQILACLMTVDSKTSTKNDGIINILQIWDYGSMSKILAHPVHKYSLVLDWGKIIKMLWISADVVNKNNVKSCEYRNHNSESPQELYGHMLFVCADGTIKIIPIAKFSEEEVNTFDFIESESAAPQMVVLEINHANIMHLGMSTSYINDTKDRFGYPTCVDWRSKFASMVLIGFSSGFVAIFDLSVAHHTRYDYTNNYLAPVCKKRVSYSSVTAVSFSPIDWKQFNVTVAPNIEGTTNFNVNLASNFGPIDVLMSDKPFHTVIWPNRADILIAVPSTKNKVIIKSILSLDTIEVHTNKITSIFVCDLLNSIIVVTECGSLLSISLSNPSVLKALIEPNDSIDLTSVPSHITSYRYNTDTDKKGEFLRTFITIKSKADLVPLYDSHKKIEYPTICSMSLNPNIYALGYVAVAFDNGIMNVLRFSERDISLSIQSLIKCNIRPEISCTSTPVAKITKSVNIKTIKVAPVTCEKKRSRKPPKVKDTPEYDPLDRILYPKQTPITPSPSDYNSPTSGRKVKKESYSKTKRISKRSKYKNLDTESDTFSNISDIGNFTDQIFLQHNEDCDDREVDMNSSGSSATERMTDSCTDYDLVPEDNIYNEELKDCQSSYSQSHLIDEEMKSKIPDSVKNENMNVSTDLTDNLKSEKKTNLEHDKELSSSKFIEKSNIEVVNIEKVEESSLNDEYVTDNIEIQEKIVNSDMDVASNNCFSIDSEENKCTMNYELNTNDEMKKSAVVDINLDFAKDFTNSTTDNIAKESGDEVMNENKTEILLASNEMNNDNVNLNLALDSINADNNERKTTKKTPRIKLVSYSLSNDSGDDKSDIASTDNSPENLNISKIKSEKFSDISKSESKISIDYNTIDSAKVHEYKDEKIENLVNYHESSENLSPVVCSEETEVSSSKVKLGEENDILPLPNSDINQISNDRIQIIFDDSDLNVEYGESDSISTEETRSTPEIIDDNTNRNIAKLTNMLDTNSSLNLKDFCKTVDISAVNSKSDNKHQVEQVVSEENSIIYANNVDNEFPNTRESLDEVANNLNIEDKITSFNQVNNSTMVETVNRNSNFEINPLSSDHYYLENQPFVIHDSTNNEESSENIIGNNSSQRSNSHIKTEQNLEHLEVESLNSSSISYSEEILKKCLNNKDNKNPNRDCVVTDNEQISISSSKLKSESSISGENVLLQTIVENKNDVNANNETIIQEEETVNCNEFLLVSDNCALESLENKSDSINSNICLNNELVETAIHSFVENVICQNDSESMEIEENNLKANEIHEVEELAACQKRFKVYEKSCTDNVIKETSAESNIQDSETICIGLKDFSDESFVEINNKSECDITTDVKFDYKIEPVKINITNDELDKNEIVESKNELESTVKADSEKHTGTVESNITEIDISSLDNKIIDMETKAKEALSKNENKVTGDNLDVEFIAVNYSKQKLNSVSNNVFQFLNKIQQTFQSIDEGNNVNLASSSIEKEQVNTENPNESTVLKNQTSPLNLKMNPNQNSSSLKKSDSLEGKLESENKCLELSENSEKSKFVNVNMKICEVESKLIHHDKIDNENAKLIVCENFDQIKETKSNSELNIATDTPQIMETVKILNVSEIDKPSIYGIVELINTSIQNSTNTYFIQNSVVDKSILSKENIKKSVSEKLDKLTKILPKNEISITENSESATKSRMSFNTCTGSIESISVKQDNSEDLFDKKCIENRSNVINNQNSESHKVMQKVIRNNESNSVINIENSTAVFNSAENIKDFNKILNNMPKILPKSKTCTKTNKLKEHDVTKSEINQKDNKVNSIDDCKNNELIRSSLLKNVIVSYENVSENSNLNLCYINEQNIKETTQKNVEKTPNFTTKINFSDKHLNKTDQDQNYKVKEMNEKKTYRKRTTNYSFNNNMENSDDVPQKFDLAKSLVEENSNKRRKLESIISDKHVVTVVTKHANNKNNNKLENQKQLPNTKKLSTESVLPLRNPISVLKQTRHSQKEVEPVKKLKTINQYKSEMSKSKEIDLDEKVSLEENCEKANILTHDKDEGDKQKRTNKTKSHPVNKEFEVEKEITLKSKKRKLSSAENSSEKIKQSKVDETIVNKRISARLNKQSDMLVPESSTTDIINTPKLEGKSNFSVSNSTNSEESSSRKTGNVKNSKAKMWWYNSIISIEWLDEKYKGGHQRIKGFLLENEPIVNKETLVRWPKITSKQYPAIVRHIYYDD